MPRAVRNATYDTGKAWLDQSRMEARLAGYVTLVDLPSADPGVADAIWNNSGTPTISLGSASVSPSASASPSS